MSLYRTERRRRVGARVRIAGAALTALSLLTGPASAFHNQATPISDDSLGARGWVSYRFSVPEDGEFGAEVQGIAKDSSILGGGVWILDGTGALLFGFMGTGWGTSTERHLQLPQPLGVVLHERSGGANGLFGLALDVAGAPAGEYVAIVGLVADQPLSDTHGRLFGGDGVSLLNKTQGDQSFINYEPDFSGTANVLVSQAEEVGDDVVWARAKAMVATSVAEKVGGTLFGWYGANLFDPAVVMTYDGPDGSQAGSSNYFFFGTQPGDYVFNVHANAGAGFAGLWAWGLEVTPA